MNNKALSGVVTTVIMIGLVVAAISIVWVFVNNLVTDEIAGAESCFEVFDQIKIGEYTCMKKGKYGDKIYLPKKKSGKTYFIDMDTFYIHNPYKIEITPIVEGESCDIADVYLEIPECDDLYFS